MQPVRDPNTDASGDYGECGQFDAEGSYGSAWNGGQDRDEENCPEQAERLGGAIAEAPATAR